ncbi:MAG TPA: HAMP domain-containing protein, partial [Candidatus Wallbacteria bacterium]|nr:HAMP domain-containing protein [Candidatus Wallbacteria bacterium]
MFKTLKGKITFIYSLLVAAMFIIGGISIWNLHSLNQSMEGLMVNNYKSIDMANRMMESIERQDSAMLTYLSFDKTGGIELFHDNGSNFSKWFRIEETNITEAGEKELVEKIGAEYQAYSKSFSELQEIKNNKGTAGASIFYNENIHKNLETIKKMLTDIDSLNEKAMFMGREKLMEKTGKTVNALILIFSATIIGGFLLSGYFTDMFLRPVYLLTETIKKLRAGDLNQQAEVVSDDEIGVLASEFNNMTRRLLAFEKSAIGDLMNERNRSIAIVHSISD